MADPRPISARYEDPVDLIWIETARRLGMEVERSDEVFASWDGMGVLRIATPEHFDPDDSVAQLVFHEICHAIVEGPQAFARPDWGLCNRDERHLLHEHACHRIQAHLAREHGLSGFLAPTTEHRPYYDALGPAPLAPYADPAASMARAAHVRLKGSEWAGPVREGLQATASILAVVAPFAPADSLLIPDPRPSR